MEVLFRREQTSGRRRETAFKLWGKIELDDESKEIMRKYRFDNAIVIEVEQPELISAARTIGFWLSIIFAFLAYEISNNILIVILGILLGIGLAWLYYDRHRETLTVKDLLHGRNFTCYSVVELAQKEAYIRDVVCTLRQIMESAKHWDGTETTTVPVLPPDEAKELILRL